MRGRFLASCLRCGYGGLVFRKRDRRAGKKEEGERSTEMHGRIVVLIEGQLVDDERDDFGAEGGQGREGGDRGPG